MNSEIIGKKLWVIPDCELPPEGDGVMKGHESVIVVNDGDGDAHIAVKLFFTDREPYTDISWTVGAQRVRCFRMANREDMCGFDVPRDTQYAMKLCSDRPVVVQYGRLDNRQVNLAYYTTLGFTEQE